MVLQIRHPVGIVWAVGTLEPIIVIGFSIVSVVVIGIGFKIATWSWYGELESAFSSGGC